MWFALFKAMYCPRCQLQIRNTWKFGEWNLRREGLERGWNLIGYNAIESIFQTDNFLQGN